MNDHRQEGKGLPSGSEMAREWTLCSPREKGITEKFQTTSGRKEKGKEDSVGTMLWDRKGRMIEKKLCRSYKGSSPWMCRANIGRTEALKNAGARDGKRKICQKSRRFPPPILKSTLGI